MGQCCGAPNDSRGAADLKKLDVDSKLINNRTSKITNPNTCFLQPTSRQRIITRIIRGRRMIVITSTIVTRH